MDSPSPFIAENRLRRRAQQYIDARQLVAAQMTLESLLQRLPNDAAARMELAWVLRTRGQLRTSISQLIQAAQAFPVDAELNIQLVRRLYLGGEILAARDCLGHFERIPNPSVPALAAQAHLRWMLGEISESRKLIDRAMAAGIDTPDECYLHAMLLQFTGEVDRAGEVLDKCLQRWPTFGGAAMALANLRKQTTEANHLQFLKRQIGRIPENSNVPGDNLVRAEFEAALFKELDDLGRHDEAWSALARSNARMHVLNPYKPIDEAAVTDALISQSDSTRITHGKPTPMGGSTPIFIVGMPRSGTTLLDRMLSNHSEVTSAGEINDFLRQFHWAADIPSGGVQDMLNAIQRSADVDFAELGARYLRQSQWRAQGRRYYIDKLPTNIQLVSFIRRALPHAPILHMVREPMDVCFSNFRAMFGNASAYSYDMQALAHYYGQYHRLTNHWRATMPDVMFDVSYTALVNEPDTTLRQVLAYCGLDVEEDCLHPERNPAPVATPSSVQVREPIHTRALGQWRHYAAYLEPLRLALSAHQSALNSATKS